MCPMGVFDIEDLGGSSRKGDKSKRRAIVARPRDCTMCRECIRKDGWDRRVSLKRVARHFIFTVESTGILPPEEIVRRVCTFNNFYINYLIFIFFLFFFS